MYTRLRKNRTKQTNKSKIQIVSMSKAHSPYPTKIFTKYYRFLEVLICWIPGRASNYGKQASLLVFTLSFFKLTTVKAAQENLPYRQPLILPLYEISSLL